MCFYKANIVFLGGLLYCEQERKPVAYRNQKLRYLDPSALIAHLAQLIAILDPIHHICKNVTKYRTSGG